MAAKGSTKAHEGTDAGKVVPSISLNGTTTPDDLELMLAQMERPKGKAAEKELTSDELSQMVARLAEIEASLTSMGAYALLDEKETLRGKLKEAMGRQQRPKVIDEVTNSEGVLQPSFSKVWDPIALRPMLKTKQQRTSCIIETVDGKAVEALIKLGVFRERDLEDTGALVRRLRSVSLLVRPIAAS
jgi:hypothetical protein